MVSDDIVTRLRNEHGKFRVVVGVNEHIVVEALYSEAADEIERLRALTGELAQLMMPFALLMSAEEQQKVLKAVRGEK